MREKTILGLQSVSRRNSHDVAHPYLGRVCGGLNLITSPISFPTMVEKTWDSELPFTFKAANLNVPQSGILDLGLWYGCIPL